MPSRSTPSRSVGRRSSSSTWPVFGILYHIQGTAFLPQAARHPRNPFRVVEHTMDVLVTSSPTASLRRRHSQLASAHRGGSGFESLPGALPLNEGSRTPP